MSILPSPLDDPFLLVNLLGRRIFKFLKRKVKIDYIASNSYELPLGAETEFVITENNVTFLPGGTGFASDLDYTILDDPSRLSGHNTRFS